MKQTEIIAEIQENPNNLSAYRRLIAYYKDCNLLEEASAFEHLLDIKYGLNSTDSCKEPTKSNNSNDPINTKSKLPNNS